MIFLRIEKLELNKVKVTVYPIDLTDMNLTIKALKPDSPQLHTFLFKVMERVKKETGFNPYHGQIVVEASPKGDCVEIVVTKVSNKPVRKIDKKSIKSVRATVKKKEISESVYIFDKFDDMCKAIILLEENSLKKSSCYEIEDNFVLCIKDVSIKENAQLKEYCIDIDTGNYTSQFLLEHGKLIAKDDSFISLFDGLKALY